MLFYFWQRSKYHLTFQIWNVLLYVWSLLCHPGQFLSYLTCSGVLNKLGSLYCLTITIPVVAVYGYVIICLLFQANPLFPCHDKFKIQIHLLALFYNRKLFYIVMQTAEEAMTPIESTFSLDVASKLDWCVCFY